MSWQCKLLDIVGIVNKQFKPPKIGNVVGETLLVDSNGKEYKFEDLDIGTMFFVPKNCNYHDWPWYRASLEDLSEYYFNINHKNRQPLFIILPGHNLFLVDGKCWANGKGYGGWQVNGDPPKITMIPSIHLHGIYHGFLKDGILSDDVDGRTF